MTTVQRSVLVLVAVVAVGCSTETGLDWNQGDGYRWAHVEPGGEDAGFRRLDSSATGVSFVNRLTDEEIGENQTYLNGSGVAAGDVDGDGLTDLYFASLHGPNRLYRNRGGFTFEEITDSAGVVHEGRYSTGTVLEDVDGDEDLDLLVGSVSKGVALYLNDGDGHFTEQSHPPMEVGKGNMTLALADIDGDGDLDLYVANYKERPVEDIYSYEERKRENTVRKIETATGTKYEVVPPFDEHYVVIDEPGKARSRRETGERDALYLNEGNGTFEKVSDLGARFLGPRGKPRGLSLGWGLNASFRDINRDGAPDLHVNNDYWTPDRIWINDGTGVFRAVDSLAIRSSSFSSMTVDFSDFNRDGALDFFVTEMLSPVHSRRLRQVGPHDPFPTTGVGDRPQYNRNSLYLNRGDGTYAEISYFSGMEATEWSWATRFLDVDLDGYDDILVNTGFSYDIQDLGSQIRLGRKMLRTPGNERYITSYPRLRLKNKSFRNQRNLSFSERGEQWGFGTEADVSHGMVTADFDRDGDLDLAVNRLNAAAAIYENITPNDRVAVRLRGKPPNTRAIGARVYLEGGSSELAPQQEAITSGGDYLSGSAPVVMFAADARTEPYTIRVDWPDGTATSVEDVRANRLYEIDQRAASSSTPGSGTPQTEADPLFADVSEKISHRHHESRFDDFSIQPLLPISLSEQGPGISWIDYDADGDDDLLIPSGRGGRLALYENDGGENFSPRELGGLTGTTSADQTSVIGWPTTSGTELVVGRANYEPRDLSVPSALHYSVRGNRVQRQSPIPGILSTTGPLAAADYDGDGDLDLFVGGRFVPTQYPRDATSRLFTNGSGGFSLDAANSQKLESVGMVTGAAFTDVDLDGDPDLVVSRAWDSLMLFENDDGVFTDRTAEVGLDAYSGWWNGVATGDFNNDGRPDLVATNWGTNSPYQVDGGQPIKMYYQDFNGDGRPEIIESYHDPGVGGYVPRRKLPTFMSSPVPIQVKAPNQFARRSLAQLLGGNPDRHLSTKSISTLESTVFLNEGDQFSPRALPPGAQFSAAFHPAVFDFNNDGNEDLFLTQNFFAVRPHLPRLDAGRGVLLRGNGEGDFEAIPGHGSGIKAYGEQRGAAVGDFNNDGKADLAVAQNDHRSRLYENQASSAGIVIRLEGPAANRGAVGASVRLVYPDGSRGPRRTVKAGSGYWSQSSFTQILGYTAIPSRIEVTWPDGRVTTVEVVSKKRRYRVRYAPDGP